MADQKGKVPGIGRLGDEVRGVAAAGRNPIRKALTVFVLGGLFLVGLILAPKLVETNNSGFFTIKQAAGTGTMRAVVEEGMFVQMFGDIHKYRRADTLTFSSKNVDVRGRLTQPISVRYRDGATGEIMGNIRFKLPTGEDKLIALHRDFRSYAAVVNDMILPALRQATLLTASLVTAEESYTTRRAELDSQIEDQLKFGIFRTRKVTKKLPNQTTGELELRAIAEVLKDENGNLLREDPVLAKYGIEITVLVIDELDYEQSVKDQIAAKRSATMAAVTAKAKAEESKQDRISAKEKGLANVETAKYEEEVKKIKATTEAQKKLEVAVLDRKAAKEEKQAKILRGQGEAQARKLVMVADGALKQKLQTIERIAKYAADAVANAKQPIVPSTVFGGGGPQRGSNGASDFVNILTMQAAKNMSLSLKTK